MKIIKNVTIYKCDHCGKTYQKKFYCMKHEEMCRQNPANHRPCFDCKYLEMKKIEYGEIDPNDEEFGRADALYCNKRKHFVYPPCVKKPYLEEEDPDANWPMPKECEFMEIA